MTTSGGADDHAARCLNLIDKIGTTTERRRANHAILIGIRSALADHDTGSRRGGSRIDTRFVLQLVGGMHLNSPDLRILTLPANFGVAEFDEFHRIDRVAKGIEKP